MSSVALRLHKRLKGERLEGRIVLVVGRAGMDLYPLPDGTTIEDAESFVSDIGGSAGNIAVALVRLGVASALLSAFSDDAIGRFVAKKLDHYGVDISHCVTVSGLARTSLAVAESRNHAPSVVIYRNDAADLAVSPEAVERLAMTDIGADIGAVIITGTALSSEPSRGACWRLAEKAEARGCPLILDIDYRPQAWGGLDEASAVLGRMAKRAEMVVGNDEEFAVIAGAAYNGREFAHEHAHEFARGLAAAGGLVVYKMGQGGCDILAAGEKPVHVGIYKVEALKPFGAGDAFLGGVLSGLAVRADIRAAVARGATSAALVVSKRGCASAMPDAAELAGFMASRIDGNREED